MFNSLLKQSRWMFFLIGLVLALTSAARAESQAEKPNSTRFFQEGKKEIRGTVSDTIGPMPGVAVSVKNNPKIGTTTDLNGKYVLEVPDGSVIVFSMVGYTSKEVSTKGKSVINMTMEESSQMLDEAVVVAFGTQKKESVIGSITTINPAELKVPSSNLTTALAGRLSGVIAYQRSGEPGMDNAEFFIRGATTFGYKKDPLILIDGMEYQVKDMAQLTLDDIESFSILKDASANALYGARGANGVILITTKQGKEGKPKVNVRYENSISSATRNIELADPITYMKLHNESYITRKPNEATPYSRSKVDNTIAGVNPTVFPAVDWQEELLKNSTMNQRLNLNLSGGGKVASYYVSGAINQDNGILKVDSRNNFNNNIDLKKYNLRSNIGLNLTKTSSFNIRLNGNFEDYNGPLDGGEGIYRKIMRSSPVQFLPYYPYEPGVGGTEKHIMFGNLESGNYLNPYADMVKGYKESARALMVAQLEWKQDLPFVTQGLNFNMMGNVNRESFFDLRRSYKPFFYTAGSYDKLTNSYRLNPLNPDTGTDYLDFNEGDKTVSSVLYMQSVLNYNRTFEKKHTVGGTLVSLLSSKLDGNAGGLQESLAARNLGVSGRATYGYDNRYFAEFNFGYNGSERFYKTERWGFFPSAGLAWQISNEKFFEPYRATVSKLKVRGNYGLVGNDAIGDKDERFFYLSEVNMSNGGMGASFGSRGGYSRPGISISRYANPNVTWETAKNSTFGLELGLWSKLDIIAEYFTEHRSNILMDRASIPKTMGLQGNLPKANVGEAKSKSYELQLDYNNAVSKNLYIGVRGNFTYARNKYQAYEEQVKDYPWEYKVGHSTSQTWGYIAERLFVDDEEVRNSPIQNFSNTMGGDIKYKDINGDGIINDFDKVPLGYPTRPEIIYGFGFSISYKGFDANAFFQGSARSSFWIDASATAPFVEYRKNSSELAGYKLQNQLLKAYADNHWSEQNRDLYALWPRLSPTLSENANNLQTSTWFMRNGSFLRIKQIELGYTFPQKLSQRAKLSNLRLYATGSNIFTFSKFKLWDIEMGGNGLGYPVQRVINFGLQVGI
ncbi:TonB-dependent receptor plug [Pseudopedobacter saltans DSM 12145]|uniref:TonB-dependent receptor plug n=1 Tax=Pseudopedobacter saltans (strain ATCC 51119 / DSM 12145 / JCM 21818 / CCUG 39354 / LMG 10337 / NBRC 100064 / NCIMB 13643) TaxID=762903 RepID=F0S4X3_PSESL|nr:TonB-dependent receptor [Pseudopedobacter saltans]ADY54147.1 TonB-dependent receptor plug [Pseudopedobacter saltans DSM 12145]